MILHAPFMVRRTRRAHDRVMRSPVGVLVLMAVAVSASAADRRGDAVAEEIQAILREESNTVVSELTFGEIEVLLGRLSIPLQEEAYVRRSALASRLVPGLGQFLNGETASGALFLGADIAVAVGTLVATYLLLPPELQFGSLDYFNTSFSVIRDTWSGELESMTFVEALPALGVMAGGMALHAVLSVVSSHHAQRLARARIESGELTFEPRIALLGCRGPGGMGIGLGLGLRYR